MPNRGYAYKTPGLRTKYRRENYAQTIKNATKAYQPWDGESDKAIMAEDRPQDRVLSEKLGRSVKAIQLRRVRLVKLQKPKDES